MSVGRDAGSVAGVARRVAAVIRRIIGVPDYEAYVAHVRSAHPGQEPMSERDFNRERLSARYSRPGSRCC
ncbi:MAG: YbdD/YjiX family protein [Gemmatimonadaceae bacterium]